jgi:hypothetical protein
MYYSLNYGLMHIVFVAGYCPEMRDWAQPIPCLAPGSPQLNWLINDLASVNRAKTPHVIIIIHQPWYVLLLLLFLLLLFWNMLF